MDAHILPFRGDSGIDLLYLQTVATNASHVEILIPGAELLCIVEALIRSRAALAEIARLSDQYDGLSDAIAAAERG